MGVSTDAIVAYGYDLGEIFDHNLDWLEDADDTGGAINQRLREKVAGFTDTWESSPEDYYERETEADEQTGVEIVYHCHIDYPMYFLSARGSEQRVYRGYPEALRDLTVQEGWDEAIAKAVEALGVKIEGKPQWFLMSYWA